MNATFIIKSKIIIGTITIKDCNSIDINEMYKELATWEVNESDITLITNDTNRNNGKI